jgi:YVTN family beta-propeller protein
MTVFEELSTPIYQERRKRERKPGSLAVALPATLGIISTMLIGMVASVPSLQTALAQTSAPEAPVAPNATYSTPTTSSPIAMTNDKLFVWAANSSDDSVYVINASTNAVVSKITVGDDPQAVAIDPNSEYAYVANAADNSVSVIHITGGGAGGNVEKTFATGAEPWNVVIFTRWQARVCCQQRARHHHDFQERCSLPDGAQHYRQRGVR